MILLHVAVTALYALAAWSLWPAQERPGAPSADGGHPAAPRRAPWAAWLLPAALLLHAWLLWHDVVTPDGFDLSFVNAVSVVGLLIATVALASGLLATLPVVGTVVLPVAALAVLLPAVVPAVLDHPHDYAFAGKPLAAAHVAVALVSYALFLVAAVQALILMGLEKRLRGHLPDRDRDRLPPLLTLERYLFRLVTAGFVLLTLTLGSGMLFSEQLFGRPMVFNHKSVLSLLGWLTFGGLLWGRWRYGWRGRVALRWILAGTLFVFLAYLGYKFVLEVVLGR